MVLRDGRPWVVGEPGLGNFVLRVLDCRVAYGTWAQPEVPCCSDTGRAEIIISGRCSLLLGCVDVTWLCPERWTWPLPEPEPGACVQLKLKTPEHRRQRLREGDSLESSLKWPRPLEVPVPIGRYSLRDNSHTGLFAGREEQQ